MKLRPRQDIGTIPFEPDTYGRTALGIPLHVWKPSSNCKVLIHAGIHGEEAETTFALSRALRLQTEPSEHCAVVLAANPDGLTRGTRGNANGVDLNRNFPTADWVADPVTHRSTLEDPSDVELSPGSGPGSEAETKALIRLIEDMQPETVVALHAPLACIDDANEGTLARWLAEKTGLPLVAHIGYPTPGSLGTWGAEQGISVVTFELPLTSTDALARAHVPVLAALIAGEATWS